ncbi:hypothetical protein CIB93_28595 [Streptomyces sp. WZ.A104]|uniref:hypothetical protein n=1 Tax=Streptomyces sp. WZ.A104 TaxID=2023771 RepID=UPI000BBBF5EF|nr:hypothetical protein [Streptomyces sp. WZ.A104]PCG82704.1 hypothetical protein CIB93_28595 [Streptomyces sp. WZ.A104]
MISEPELVGEFEPGAPAEAVSGFDRKPASGRRRGAGLLWGLGGAVVASAVWAAAVFTYGFGDGKPDLRGYRLGEEPCAAMKLTALSGAAGKAEDGPSEQPGRIEHPAVDRVDCAVSLTPFEAPEEDAAAGWSVQLYVPMRIELHKETDPGPEFEALIKERDPFGTEVVKAERIPDLGDSAYLVTMDDDSSQVSVLDGGAVITLGISVSTLYDGEDDDGPDSGPVLPELSPYQGALISDVREVIDALKA